MFSKIALAKMIDHSLLRPDATEDDVIRCCEEAKELHFACLMVLPYWCPVAERRLRDSDVKVGTVVAYPFGVLPTNVKAYEARQSIGSGAVELDIVVNLGAVKSHDYSTVQRDLEEVVTVAKLAGLTEDGDDILAKVIIEVGFTTREEQTRVCRIAKARARRLHQNLHRTGAAGGGRAGCEAHPPGGRQGDGDQGLWRHPHHSAGDGPDQCRRQSHRHQHRRPDRGGLRPVPGRDDGGSAAIARLPAGPPKPGRGWQ